jgi:hypothetical protein
VGWHREGFALLEVAITSPCWATENYRRNSGTHPPAGRRECALANAQDLHGELQKLGFVISERTVARLGRRGDSRKAWLTFLRNHWEVIAAFDFFTLPTVTFQVLYCFFVIEHGHRKILHFNVTRHPTRSGSSGSSLLHFATRLLGIRSYEAGAFFCTPCHAADSVLTTHMGHMLLLLAPKAGKHLAKSIS